MVGENKNYPKNICGEKMKNSKPQSFYIFFVKKGVDLQMTFVKEAISLMTFLLFFLIKEIIYLVQ